MDFSTIAGMAGGHAEARAIQIALKLGIFERLNAAPLEAGGLASSMGGEPRATAILANAMVALGLLHKIDGRYQLDQSAQRFLVESSPEYLGGMILFDAELWDEWGRLEDSIRSGAPVPLLPTLVACHVKHGRIFCLLRPARRLPREMANFVIDSCHQAHCE